MKLVCCLLLETSRGRLGQVIDESRKPSQVLIDISALALPLTVSWSEGGKGVYVSTL